MTIASDIPSDRIMTDEELAAWRETPEAKKLIMARVRYTLERTDWINQRLVGLAIMAACALLGRWAFYIIVPLAAYMAVVKWYDVYHFPKQLETFQEFYEAWTGRWAKHDET